MENLIFLRQQDDNTLIQLFINGNEQAWDVIYWKYHKSVFKNLLKVLKEFHTTEDFSQEIWTIVCQKIRANEYRPNNFGAWISRIATNYYIDFFRNKKRKHSNYPILSGDSKWLEVVGKQDADTDAIFVENDLEIQLPHLIEKLRKNQAMVINLFYFGGVSIKQVAILQKVSVNTTSARLRYGRKNLKKMIKSKKPAA